MRVVYTILFSYFENVPNLSKETLVGLVANCYNKMKVRGRYLGKSYILNTLNVVSTGLRYSKGILTYDELRNFLAQQYKDSADLVLPCGDEIFKLFKDIVSHGMISGVQSASSKLLRIVPTLKSLLSEELLREGPLVKGIISSIQESFTQLVKFQDDEVTLYEAIDGISFIDGSSFDNRRKSVVIGMLGKVLVKGLKTYLPKDGVIMYGSSMGSDSMDSSTFIMSSLMNEEFAMMNLNELVEPKTPQNTWEAMADYFKSTNKV